MNKLDQAKMLLKVKKLQKELQKVSIVATQGNGAVSVEISGETQNTSTLTT
jgi:DNA-binding protein YbaB